MKQLYVIGILVGILLIALLGLSKLGGGEDTTVPTNNLAEKEILEANIGNITMDTGDQEQATVTTPQENVTVVMKTSKGDITIELYTLDMPVTAGNFLKLAREDFYDGVKFHRVIDGFMIQGGDPLTKDDEKAARWGTGGPGYAIPDEFGPRYSNTRGTLSMANSGPNTGGSQFFINTADNVFLDGKHPVFGRVVSGTEVLLAISKTETGPRDVPLEPVVILDISEQ